MSPTIMCRRRQTKALYVSVPASLTAGAIYRVLGYHTGTFVGIVKCDHRHDVEMEVSDPLATQLTKGQALEIPKALVTFGEVEAGA